MYKMNGSVRDSEWRLGGKASKCWGSVRWPGFWVLGCWMPSFCKLLSSFFSRFWAAMPTVSRNICGYTVWTTRNKMAIIIIWHAQISVGSSKPGSKRLLSARAAMYRDWQTTMDRLGLTGTMTTIILHAVIGIYMIDRPPKKPRLLLPWCFAWPIILSAKTLGELT